MAKRKQDRTDSPDRARPREDTPEQTPTWRNTRPRANQETDQRDLKRSRERFETVLGR